MKSKELFVDLWDKIVAWHGSGQGYETLSKALSIPRSTLDSIIVKLKTFVATRTLPRVGHLAKLIKRAGKALARQVTKNPMVTLTEFRKYLYT